MSFIDPSYLLLLAAVATAYWRLPRRGQNVLILVASLVFYGWVHPGLVLLLLGSSLLDVVLARRIEADRKHTRRYVVASVVGNLGTLAVFKYLGFFRDNVAAAAGLIGLQLDLPVWDLLLPVGISFYTFQTLGYTLDVAAGRARGDRDPLDVLTFCVFFPQLVAGPIERADGLLVQRARARTWSSDHLVQGLRLLVWGAFCKVVVADTIAVAVDRIFVLSDPPPVLIWAGTVGFALQIFADFSGYTDLARGSARLLGIELRPNFRAPYAARGPADFWRRWHITLSTWFRDHVYIPLGGGRRGLVTAIVAGWITFLLSGLWHGAAWTFLLWGALHALWWSSIRLGRAAGLRPWPPIAARAVTLVVVVVGWLVFRETHLDRLVHHLSSPPWTGDPHAHLAALGIIMLTALLAAPLCVPWPRWRSALPAPLRPVADGAVWSGVLLSVVTLYGGAQRSFVYFQF